MDSYRTAELSIALLETDAPARIFLSWEGRSSEREPRRTLGVYLRGVVDHAAARGAAIEMHFQRIAYINSATIGCLGELIRSATTAGVPLTLRYDASTTWQRISFEALGVFAKGDGKLVLEPV